MTENPGLAAARRSWPRQHNDPSRSRDTAIDILRGMCIVSMTTAHVAAGSLPYQVAHAAVFIDGAVGFVLLSGVMVGRVQRRAVATGGLRAGTRKLLRRVGLIYLAHIALCLVGMAVVAADPVRGDMYSGVDSLGGPVPAALATLGLQVNPYWTSILSLYVVLLLLAIPAVAAMSARLPGVVAAASIGLYVAGSLCPEPFTFAQRPGVPSAVAWATWQLLFTAALLVGWYWRGPVMRKALASRGLLCVATGVVLAGAALGWITTTGQPAPWKSAVGAAFSDGSLGPGRVIMAFAAVLVGYRVCRRMLPRAARVLAPLSLIGRHALDCYVLLSVVVIVLPGGTAYDTTGLIGVVVAADVLVMMLIWCTFRDRLRTRSLGRLQQHPG